MTNTQAHGHRKTFIARCALIVVAVVALSVLGTTTAPEAIAEGTNCPHGGNWGSTACLFNFTWQFGTYSEWNSNAQAVVSPAVHINRSIWSYSSCDLQKFVEGGLWSTPSANYFYGAYQLPGYHAPLPDFSAYTPLDGSHHYYRLVFQGPSIYGVGTYQVVIDGVTRFTYPNSNDGICMSQAGLEVGSTNLDGTSAAVSTAASPLAWQDSGYSYHYGWDTGQWWVDHLCWPFGSGTSPYCMVGVFSGSNSWTTAK